MSDEKKSPLGIEGAPTQEQIDAWKIKHGDIFVAPFSPTEKFIYRSIKRVEYKQLVDLNISTDNRAFAEERVAQQCILWPEITAASLPTMKAGTISTLVDLIMAASNFGINEEPQKL